MGSNWDSGWRSSSTSGGGTGGRFDSDDDGDKHSEHSTGGGGHGVSEFKDDDDFGGKKSPRNVGLPRKPSGGRLSDFNRSASTSSAVGGVNGAAVKKSAKPSRKVDLGAAAEFANKAKLEQKTHVTENNNNQVFDFFAESSNPKPSQPDYVQIDDDFDPRAGEKSGPAPVKDSGADLFGGDIINSNSNDDFADFSSAFVGSETSTAKNTAASDDLFGGFSGGGQTLPNSGSADLFAGFSSGGPASLPVPPAVSQAPVQPATGGFDLFGGMTSQPTPTAAANSMDLLGGLDFAGMSFLFCLLLSPWQITFNLYYFIVFLLLIGVAPSPQPNLFNNLAPSNNAFNAGGGLMGGGPMSLPTLQPSSALPVSPVAAASNGVAQAPVNVGGTWKDLG